jgi:hypothetical protein
MPKLLCCDAHVRHSVSVAHDPTANSIDTTSRTLEGLYIPIWESEPRSGCDSATIEGGGASSLKSFVSDSDEMKMMRKLALTQ